MTKHVGLGVLVAGLLLAGGVAAVAEEAAGQGWVNTLSAGGSMTDGNSEQMQLNVGVLGEKKTDVDATRASIDYAYGEISGDTTNNNIKANFNYKRTIDERLYGVGDLSGLYDEIADIDYRVTVSPGLGYYLMKDAKATLSAEAGPAYVWEKVGGVEDDYFALRFAERYDRQLSEGAKVWQALEYLPRADDFDDYILNAEIGAEAAMNAKLALRLVLKDTYDSTPAPGKEENDLSVVGSLVYKL